MSDRGNFSQYAQHIGASAAYVSKLRKQGRLVVVQDAEGKDIVDFAMSDRLLRNTTDMGRARNGENASPGRAPSAPLEPVAASGRVDAIFRQAQAQERAYAAKITELEYRERIGELVRASDVRAALSKSAAGLRETLLQLPARVVPLLAANPDPAHMDKILRAEIVTALAQLVGEVQ